jgi:hypothetical protein
LLVFRVRFLGDGHRDKVTVPRIVGGILKTEFDDEFFDFVAWSDRRLHGESGNGRRLKFVVREALADGFDAVVATVDQDKDKPRERLHVLIAARDGDRSSGRHFPTGLGEARPHGEAWLLDDQVAVKSALGIAAGDAIPTVRKSRSPKDALNDLCAEQEKEFINVLPEIAASVDIERCPHAKETGFQEFVEDVRSELQRLVNAF